MLTENFNVIGSVRLAYTSNNFRNYRFKNILGDETSPDAYSSGIYYYFQTHLTMVVGSGNTDPTFQDIHLETPINNLTVVTQGNDITPVNGTNKYNDFTAFHLLTHTAVFRNDTNEPITIREIGLISRTFSQTSDSYKYMISRDVIDPVIINPGEQKAFSVSIGNPLTTVSSN